MQRLGPLFARAPISATLLRMSSLALMLIGEAAAPDLIASGELAIEGDGARLGALLGLLDAPDPDFAIVRP